MKMEQVNQACANIQYAITIDELDLVTKEDLKTLIDYVYNDSVQKNSFDKQLKIIDLMANQFYKEENFAYCENYECKKEKNKCIECIKKYFLKQV